MLSQALEHQEQNEKANCYANIRIVGGQMLEELEAETHDEDNPAI